MDTVLLIEDNIPNRENTAEILELANYKVLTAENGKVGIELALEQKPDVVVCDIKMPQMNGYGVLEAFRANMKLETTPFIFLSAGTQQSEIQKGFECGADGFLTKPFQESELLNAIEAILHDGKVVKIKSI